MEGGGRGRVARPPIHDVLRMARFLEISSDDVDAAVLEDVPAEIAAARQAGHQVQVVFLDTDDTVLLRRFSETRRRHPLADPGGGESALAREREGGGWVLPAAARATAPWAAAGDGVIVVDGQNPLGSHECRRSTALCSCYTGTTDRRRGSSQSGKPREPGDLSPPSGRRGGLK